MLALPAAPPAVTIVSRSVLVQPGKVTGLSVSCPGGKVAASAGVSRALPDVDTLRARVRRDGATGRERPRSQVWGKQLPGDRWRLRPSQLRLLRRLLGRLADGGPLDDL
ncbi:MAG TPA: hypothetical protein VF895_04565 [Gaiellaceae bacterium]